MPLCHKCGFDLARESGFCPMCGVVLESSVSPVVLEDPDEMMARMFDSESAAESREEPPATEPETTETPVEQPEEELVVEDVPDISDDTTLAGELKRDADLWQEIEPVAETKLSPDADEVSETGLSETTEGPVAEIEMTENDLVGEVDQHEPAPESIAEVAAAETDQAEIAEVQSEQAEPAEYLPQAVAESETPIADFDQTETRVSTNDFDDAGAVRASNDAGNDGHTSNSIGGETSGKKSGLKPLGEGTLLNSRYKIVKKIGGGGMGAVYLACDQNLGGIERAVKEMVQSSIEEDQQNKAVDDFKRESTILSTLDHPSIPTIYDYFFDHLEGRFYLVMKYISGGDLAGKLRSTPGGRIDEKTVTEWAIQVADVLSYLHNLPTTIVYRDLKPSNIMLDGSTGKIMLIDFGIARSINSQEKGVTAVGTMGYAPPELFSGQVEPRSDIYSLGSTMFHLLTGADPQNNPLLIFDFQKHPRPRQINPQMSDEMERILMRSVEYKAESRFSSADAMKRALGEHLDNLRLGQVTFGVSEAPAAVSLENQYVFCGFCGQQIVATDLFCAYCGAKQPIAQQGVHADIYPRTGATARLIVDGTSELDAPEFSLERNENLVGRRDPQSNIFPEVDLSKYDPQTKISRRHARIWRDGGSFLIEDLGSSNGTVLLLGANDSMRLSPRQPHPLANGDRLRLGDTTLHFLMS